MTSVILYIVVCKGTKSFDRVKQAQVQMNHIHHQDTYIMNLAWMTLFTLMLRVVQRLCMLEKRFINNKSMQIKG